MGQSFPKVASPAPSPQGIFTATVDLEEALRDDMSLVAIAVGYSEGNRTLEGGFTSSYWGHKDPGNSKRNQGSFSYQHRAASPKEADLRQLQKLREELTYSYQVPAKVVGLDPANAFLLCSFCDLFTQSEAAVIAPGGLISQFKTLTKEGLSVNSMVAARVRSYYDLNGHLDAPGFDNDPKRLEADQRRRTEAIVEVLRKRLNV